MTPVSFSFAFVWTKRGIAAGITTVCVIRVLRRKWGVG